MLARRASAPPWRQRSIPGNRGQCILPPEGYAQAAQEVLAAVSAMTRSDPRMEGARLIEFESKSRSATRRRPRQDCRRLKIGK
jgi:hypothetical protein